MKKNNDPNRFLISFDNPSQPPNNQEPSQTVTNPYKKPSSQPISPGILCDARPPPACLSLDRPITFKRGMFRPHVHKYDLSIVVKKPKSDDDEEALVQKALQCFLEIMLQAEQHSLITQYFELDRKDRAMADISKDFQVKSIDSFLHLKKYFS